MAQDAAKIQFGSGMADGFPESVTSTADGTLFAGSMTGGMIHKAAPGASTAEMFIPKPADGPGAVIGVFADEAQNTLWACYSDLAAFSGGQAMPSVLRAYDLGSGSEKASYAFPNPSFCNDIATTADGTAYAADTVGARVMRIKPGATEAETWFADEKLAGVDGLSFSPDGALYLNSVTTNKLFRLDMGADGAAGTLTELTPSEELKGADGMRFGDDGTLYLAENAANRVDALTIDGDKVTVKEIQGGFTGPTAVTKVGDTLWVAEARLSQLGAKEDPGPFYVHAVPLGEGGDQAAEEAAATTEVVAENTPAAVAGGDAGAAGGDYDRLTTSFGGMGTADLSKITSGNIKIVKLSEMAAATEDQSAALEAAITASQSDREKLQQNLAQNQVISGYLGELGLPTENVLSVEVGSDGGLVIYVDDRDR